MAIIRTQTGIGGQSIFHGTATALTCISRAIAVTALLLAGAASAQAADSTDRIIPPNPADVAVLRQLLALQHPALREGAAAQAEPTSLSPAVATTPGQQTGGAPSSTQGEACVGPDGKSAATCGFGAEASESKSTKLGSSFRASLDRAMAAAGFDGAHL